MMTFHTDDIPANYIDKETANPEMVLPPSPNYSLTNSNLILGAHTPTNIQDRTYNLANL
jgi:hypothetical protein